MLILATDQEGGVFKPVEIECSHSPGFLVKEYILTQSNLLMIEKENKFELFGHKIHSIMFRDGQIFDATFKGFRHKKPRKVDKKMAAKLYHRHKYRENE